MCCIEHARQTRMEFIQQLERRGFSTPEASFLTGIEVDPQITELDTYGILDPGRMGTRERKEFEKRFPEAADDIKRQLDRQWAITSGFHENIRVETTCRPVVSRLVYLNNIRNRLHVK